MDNFPVRGREGSSWVIIESARREKSTFLKNFLSKRFPKHSFFYDKLQKTRSRSQSDELLDGVIAELKSISETSLTWVDQFYRQYKKFPTILVLTPFGYQLLHKRRRKVLDRATIVISETKSLDYLIQLPRFIDEIGRKRRLKLQNERLHRLARQRIPNFTFNTQNFSVEHLRRHSQEHLFPALLPGESLEKSSQTQCGLKVKIRNWKATSKYLGEYGRTEVVDLVSRLIHEAVRNTDRVLRSQEDEFIIFLSNTNSDHMSRCKDRLEKALEGFSVMANKRDVKFPFAISTLEQLH